MSLVEGTRVESSSEEQTPECCTPCQPDCWYGPQTFSPSPNPWAQPFLKLFGFRNTRACRGPPRAASHQLPQPCRTPGPGGFLAREFWLAVIRTLACSHTDSAAFQPGHFLCQRWLLSGQSTSTEEGSEDIAYLALTLLGWGRVGFTVCNSNFPWTKAFRLHVMGSPLLSLHPHSRCFCKNERGEGREGRESGATEVRVAVSFKRCVWVCFHFRLSSRSN